MLFLFCGLPSLPFECFQELDGLKVLLRLLAQTAFPDLALIRDAVIEGRLGRFAVFGKAEI